MRLSRLFLLAAVLSAAFAFAGGTTYATPYSKAATPSLSVRRATRLAASLANAAAKRRFGLTPFSTSSAEPQLVHGRWQWQATAGYGHTDLLALVSFSQGGAAPVTNIAQVVLPQW